MKDTILVGHLKGNFPIRSTEFFLFCFLIFFAPYMSEQRMWSMGFFTASKRYTIWRYWGNSNLIHSPDSDRAPTFLAYPHVKQVNQRQCGAFPRTVFQLKFFSAVSNLE